MRSMLKTKEIARVFAARPEVVAAYVFGSVASGRTRPDSDIDIGVLLNPTGMPRNRLKYRLRLIEELGAALERFDVDVVLMNEAPPALAQNIIAKGQRVFERSRSARIAFQIRTLNVFLDTEPMRQIYLRALKRRYLTGKVRG
jgi:predicted nucleotidyltransferase